MDTIKMQWWKDTYSNQNNVNGLICVHYICKIKKNTIQYWQNLNEIGMLRNIKGHKNAYA